MLRVNKKKYSVRKNENWKNPNALHPSSNISIKKIFRWVRHLARTEGS